MTMMYRLGKAKQSAILFIYVAIVLKWDNQLQNYLRHSPVFWHKWPVHNLVLVTPPPPPPPPLIKVASNTRPYSKLGTTTLNGREEGGQY